MINNNNYKFNDNSLLFINNNNNNNDNRKEKRNHIFSILRVLFRLYFLYAENMVPLFFAILKFCSTKHLFNNDNNNNNNNNHHHDGNLHSQK